MVAYCYWANKGRRNCQPLFLLHIVFLGKFQTIVLSLSFLVLPQFPPPTFLLLHACTAMFFRGRSYVFLTPQTHFSSDSRFRMYIKWMATICYTCLQWRQVVWFFAMWKYVVVRTAQTTIEFHFTHTFLSLNATWAIHMVILSMIMDY